MAGGASAPAVATAGSAQAESASESARSRPMMAGGMTRGGCITIFTAAARSGKPRVRYLADAGQGVP
jgi:hypothetical protein